MPTDILRLISLQGFDSDWQNAIAQSNLITCLRKFIETIHSYIQKWSQAKTIGSYLDQISFYIIVLLFLISPLPQFAGNKEGLAVLLLVAFFVWALGALLSGKQIRKPTAIDALVLIFFGINIIATFSSHYFAYSMHGLLKLLVYVLAYFLFSAQIGNNLPRQIILITTLLCTGSLVSLYGLYQYKIGVEPLATWEDPGIENQATRIYATFNNPNLMAGYLLPIVMLAATILATVLYKRKILSILIAAIITALITSAIILTGSRGAYIGLGAGFLALVGMAGNVVWQRGKTKKWLLISIAALAALCAVMVIHKLPGFEQRVVSIFAGREHSSNSFRLNVWHSCLIMFKDNWLAGIGVGNQSFRLAYGLYMRSGFDALAAYSVPLEIAVEAGVFALICFLFIIISTLCRAHIMFWGSSSSNIIKSTIIAGSGLALIALFVHGLFDTVFFRPQIQFIFYLLLAVLANTSNYKDAK